MVAVRCSRCGWTTATGDSAEQNVLLRAGLPWRGLTGKSATEKVREGFSEHVCTRRRRPPRARGHSGLQPFVGKRRLIPSVVEEALETLPTIPESQEVHDFHDAEIKRMAEVAQVTGAQMATTYFWVGGTGVWDTLTTTHWSLTSGGAGGAGVPGSADTATFDTNSGGGTVTVISTGDSVAACNLAAGWGGTVLCAGSLNVTGGVTLTAGTLNTNGQTCTWGSFVNPSGTCTLTMGSSTITCTGTVGWNNSAVGMTVTANTATIILSNSTSTNWASFNYQGTSLVINTVGSCTLNNAPTLANLTYAPGIATGNVLAFAGNWTVTGNIVFTGGTAPGIGTVASNALGTARTITCNGTVTLTGRMDFRDIAAAGTATWDLTAGGGNMANNSGIIFSAGANQYAVMTGSANFSTSSIWASTSGGTGGTGRVPYPQDTSIFDANSLSTAGFVLTLDMNKIGGIDFSGIVHALTFSISSAGINTYGSIAMSSLLSRSSSGANPVVFAGSGTNTITSNGFANWPNRNVQTVGGTYVVVDNLLGPSSNLSFANGILDTATHNAPLSMTNITVTGGAACSLLAGSNTLTLVSTGNVWNVTNALFTFSAGTSTIAITDTSATQKNFIGNGLTYGTLQLASGTGSITITGNNTFASVVSGPNQLVLTAGTTQTITTAGGWQVDGIDYGYEYLPGISGNYVSSPDSAVLDITGDIDLRWYGALPAWSPTNASLISRWGSATTKSYSMSINAAGRLTFNMSVDGSTTLAGSANVAIPFAANQAGWVRTTRVQSTGVVTFYTSLDGITWTPFGGTVVVSSGSAMFNPSSILEVGTVFGGTANAFACNLYRAQVWSGVGGTLVFDADFTTKPVGANSFTESANGATVSIIGATARAGDGRVALTSSTPGTHAFISIASGTVSSNYMVIQDSGATGGAAFYAGGLSVNVSNNTGWIFTDPPTSSTASDTSLTSDSAARTISLRHAGSDTFTMSDSAGGHTTTSFRFATDSSAAADAATRVQDVRLASADTSLSQDSATGTTMTMAVATDTSGTTDTAGRTLRLFPTAADAAVSIDSVSTRGVAVRSSSDTSLISDIATVTIHLLPIPGTVTIGDSAVYAVFLSDQATYGVTIGDGA